MSEYIVTDSELISVADAIRRRGGTQEGLTWPTGYVSAINAIPSGGGGGNIKVKEFNFTGEIETFIAPATSDYYFMIWGAQGGMAYSMYPGGLGGYAKGHRRFNAGDLLYICVGGAGSDGVPRVAAAGGYNGGGGGCPYMNDGSNYAAGGGGATHIALSSGLLKDVPLSDVLIVAGGGGGAYYHTNGPLFSAAGGAGGGTEGESGFNGNSSFAAGGGGTQTTGGAAGTGGVAGSYGMAGTSTQYSAGGGGGLYGGGGARHQYTGGGSGYIGDILDGSMQSGANPGNGRVLIIWAE